MTVEPENDDRNGEQRAEVPFEKLHAVKDALLSRQDDLRPAIQGLVSMAAASLETSETLWCQDKKLKNAGVLIQSSAVDSSGSDRLCRRGAAYVGTLVADGDGDINEAANAACADQRQFAQVPA